MFESLNPAQLEAVTCGDGPVLVIAGAGSGKTLTLACRVAYLISKGVAPERILLLTFSRRAAREMLSRAASVALRQNSDLGPVRGDGERTVVGKVWGGTFHAIANRLLRLYGRCLGLSPDFTVLDQADMADLMDLIRGEIRGEIRVELSREQRRAHHKNERRFPKKDTLVAIYSRMVNAGEGLSSVLESAFPWCTDDADGIRAIFAEYTRRKRAQNVLDYDDLLLYWRALGATSAGQEAARLFDHVLVDEYQDTNPVQAEILQSLRAENRNLMVVGDDAQCLPTGTLIQTENGETPIEGIRAGDRVLAAAGRGAVSAGTVTRVRKTRYAGRLIRISLSSGRVLLATPNHMCFARMSDRRDVFYVYLMYREDNGFRVGVTMGGRVSRRSAKSVLGPMIRTTQEQADRAWVLRVTSSREEAHYYEQTYAVSFGIPTACFHPKGRAILYSQQTLDRLFNEIDTRANAQNLMRTMNLQFDYPHHFAQPVTERGATRRVLVHLGMFAGTRRSKCRPWTSHRAWVQTTDPTAKESLAAVGFRVARMQGRSWSANRHSRDIGEAESAASAFATTVGAGVARWACLSGDMKFAFQPASHLQPYMLAPVSDGTKVLTDQIVAVDSIEYDGYVYDLDVEHLHNYIANGIVVHNSIYSFRAASIRNILDFPQQFPGSRRITLEQNYRSTRPILDVSNAVIAQARERFPKNLWPVRSGGARPALLTCADEHEQSAQVCEHILEHREQGIPLRQQAVLFRSGHHSDVLELELTRRNIPFVKYGGLKFLESAHIKDVLTVLRLLENPRDEVSWFRVLQLLDGIGPAGARSIMDQLGVRRAASSPLQTLLQAPPKVPEAAQESFESLRVTFSDCLVAGGALPPAAEIARIRRFSEPIFQRRYSSPEARLQDIEQLERVAGRYSARGRFLSELALDPPTSTSDLAGPPLLDEDYLILSTVHSAKGGEWDVVHVIHAADGMIPSDMATRDEDEIEEERRLFYVALTRARDNLYVYFALRFYRRPRGLDDEHHFAQLTRFLPESVQWLFDRRTSGPRVDEPLTPMSSKVGVDRLLAALWEA